MNLSEQAAKKLAGELSNEFEKGMEALHDKYGAELVDACLALESLRRLDHFVHPKMREAFLDATVTVAKLVALKLGTDHKVFLTVLNDVKSLMDRLQNKAAAQLKAKAAELNPFDYKRND